MLGLGAPMATTSNRHQKVVPKHHFNIDLFCFAIILFYISLFHVLNLMLRPQAAPGFGSKCGQPAGATVFQTVFQRECEADNLKFLDSIKVFDGLNQKQKDQIALSALSESFDAGHRVATQGEAMAAIYFAGVPRDVLKCVEKR